MRKVIGFMLIIAMIAFAGLAKAQETQPPAEAVRTATVKEMLIAGNYVYLLVIEEGEEVWLATAPGFIKNINYGDVVDFRGEVEMRDFHSNGLNKTFDSLWLVGWIRVIEDGVMEDAAEGKLL